MNYSRIQLPLITTKRIGLTVIVWILLVFISCKTETEEQPFFPVRYPGAARAEINKNALILSNQAIKATWSLKEGIISLKKIENYYDGQVADLHAIILFAIELEGGKTYTNRDFQIQQKPKITDIAVTDSLPTYALRFAGKEISALLVEESENIIIRWSAQLRNGANYVRQKIEIEKVKEAVNIRKIIFFDGKLDGAVYAGLVLGSPIRYKNFFFGMEHPIAQSNAFFTRTVGSITQPEINLDKVINAPGEYVVSVEHGGGPSNYNIESVCLLENGEAIACDKHLLNGVNGDSFYKLLLNSYDVSKQYTLNAQLDNPEMATGSFHIHRKTDNILNFYVERRDTLYPGQRISEWSVMGVSPTGQNRRSFLYYLERERARPYNQFLHYNCWWDITTDGASSFTSEQLTERMHAWNEKFIQPFDIKLNSFVLDDGWDNLDSVWYFDPVKFPDGFAEQAQLCKKYNSGIGVWMSPFGGYLEAQQRRIKSARREGLEINDKGLSLAGENYYNRFQKRALNMLNNYNVNYFKFDGFGGSNPEYLPDMEAGARLITTLRRHNPNIYVNITVGSWPSPFWLKYADCTWRASGDLHLAGVGSRTQQFITYRDGTLYNNIVKKAPFYPLNSIMTVGIAYANLGHPKECINDSIGDFSDMVWSFFGGGSSLQELYISHDRMLPEFWHILAKAAKWSKKNEDVLKDTHWIGGSPINLEVYGFASWIPGKGIISLRNPAKETQSFIINLNELLELPPGFSGRYRLKPVYGGQENVLILQSNNHSEIELDPFETRVYEVTKEN